jgi:molybdenum cofactor biosynthesis enzyme
MNKREKIIKAMGNKIFTVTFTKKDGTVRVMNARRGVKKGVTGVGLPYDAAEKGLITVYDMKKRQFRSVNVDTVQTVKTIGITHTF